MWGLQETIKQNFMVRDLARIFLEGGSVWNWVPSVGHLGEMGVKEDRYEVGNWEIGTYFMGATVRDRITNVRADTLIVYGLAKHEWSEDFLKELEKRCKKWLYLLLSRGF
jgi:hypothetical protein